MTTKKTFWSSQRWQSIKQASIIRVLSSIYWFLIKIRDITSTTWLCLKVAMLSKFFSVQKEPYPFGEVYISLTTYPARLDAVYYTLCSILVQKRKCNKIILTLFKGDFPNGEQDLPKRILLLQKKGLELLWCEDNLKSHKKYFYAMQKYSNAIIITIDDDTIYPYSTVANLVNSHISHPHAIISLGVKQIEIENGLPTPFNEWCSNIVGEPFKIAKQAFNQKRMDFLAQGVAGVLYPPSILPKETFNEQAIKRLCIYADDFWLKCMELMANIPTVCPKTRIKIHAIYFSQETALFKINILENKNDSQFQAILEEYKDYNLLEKLKA
ncbi:hypothetical protein BGX12_11967 [Fibrobacter sp. UWR4]|nr:hypothetical protein BGX12_11967 [Fibrobacter sp. UWR4]